MIKSQYFTDHKATAVPEMVVDSESAVPAEPPPQPISKGLIEWDKIHRLHPDSTFAPLPVTPWSMVAIRNRTDDGCNGPPIVFPPINHENLIISSDPSPARNQFHCIRTDCNFLISSSDSGSDTESNSSSTLSPSDSSPVPRSPLFRTRLVEPPARSDSWAELIRSRLSGLARLLYSGVTSSPGMHLAFRSAALAMILLTFLNFRRRRRLRAAEDSRAKLLGIIQQRDERINQLLEQISQMNQMLLKLQRGPPH